MYAVIDAGGKQERVEVGSRVDVELLSSAPGDEVRLRPVLVVDGDEVVADRSSLEAIAVTARVVGIASGPKITGFTYQPKARARRRFGHRQHYSTLEVTAIGAPAPAPTRRTRTAKAEES